MRRSPPFARLTNVVLALSLIGRVCSARLVRGQVLRARELEFVQRHGRSARQRAHSGAAHYSDHASRGDRASHARHGPRDSRRSRAQLSRAGCSAAHAQLGDDGQLRTGTSAPRAAPDGVSRHRDRDSRPRVQFSRRQVEGRAGSSATAGSSRTVKVRAASEGKSGMCGASHYGPREVAGAPRRLSEPPGIAARAFTARDGRGGRL